MRKLDKRASGAKTNTQRAIATAALALALSATSALAADDKPKLSVGATGKVFDDVTLSAQFQTWFNKGDVVSQENFAFLNWKVADWLSLEIGDTLAHARKSTKIYKAGKDGTYAEVNDNYWVYENRPGFGATFSVSLDGWKISDRNRFEFREFDDRSEDHWRYRNLFRVGTPWKFTSLGISPYWSEEIFWADQSSYSGWEKFNQLRSQVGFGASLTEKIGATLYYQAKHMKRASDGDWYLNDHEYGLTLVAKF